METDPRTAATGYQALGALIRSQRELARLSLRQAAELVGISNPYLSQIEHGAAFPSITVMHALAAAFSVSVETLLRTAAVLDPPPASEGQARTEDAIRRDVRLTLEQRRALLTILAAFTGGTSPESSASTTRDATPRRRAKAPTTSKPTSREVRTHE